MPEGRRSAIRSLRLLSRSEHSHPKTHHNGREINDGLTINDAVAFLDAMLEKKLSPEFWSNGGLGQLFFPSMLGQATEQGNRERKYF